MLRETPAEFRHAAAVRESRAFYRRQLARAIAREWAAKGLGAASLERAADAAQAITVSLAKIEDAELEGK